MNPTLATLVAGGFDLSWLNQFTQKHGAEALELLLALMRTGLSPQYLYRVAEWFGKLGLELLARYLGLDEAPVFGASLGGDPGNRDHCLRPDPAALAADLRALAALVEKAD